VGTAADAKAIEAAVSVSFQIQKENMLNSKVATIQEHQEIVGSRFELAQIIMRRTKQLMNGSPIKQGVGVVGSEFNPKHRQEIPIHRYPKIALEELRTGKLK
jgi:DNA-directed RNA polymerase omega subunit